VDQLAETLLEDSTLQRDRMKILLRSYKESFFSLIGAAATSTVVNFGRWSEPSVSKAFAIPHLTATEISGGNESDNY